MTRAGGEGVASGKVILLGEHSVVYGHPAIAAGLPRGASARAAASGDRTVLAVEPWGVEVSPDPGADKSLTRALAAMVEAAGWKEPVRVDARVDLPGGSGLGSSAALGVAVMRAVDDLLGIRRSDAEALEVSLAWERVFHGNPSGVDNAMAIAGGLAWYVRGQPIERLRGRTPLTLVIGDSGEPCSTMITVGDVARQHAADPERMGKQFEAIASIVRNGRLAIERGDLVSLGQLFDMNHALLAGMLISTGTLEEMIAAARSAGALGAKLTGGGGGGCMIALTDGGESAARVKGAIEALGKRAFVATIGSIDSESGDLA